MTCWECEATLEKPVDVTIAVLGGYTCYLRLCPSCYQTCYLPLIGIAAVAGAQPGQASSSSTGIGSTGDVVRMITLHC